ncbi:MAG: sugar MFS transporter [Bacteroidetes bacterium]|nr:sugar MFS transporter [Bacteroidota bacterium]
MELKQNVEIKSEQGEKKYTSSLIILTSLFFMWGFITCLNDILIPYLKGVFALTHFQANLVQFAFFGAYFIGSLIYFLLSLLIGDPISRIGYKNGILVGLFISAVACFLFYPAANVFHSFGVFLGALFLLGLGFTVLQIAANPYVAILGSSETASSRLNLSQAFNSFGTTIAPVLGGYFIFEYFVTANSDGASSVKIPYLVLGSVLILIMVMIKFAKLPVFKSSDLIEKSAGALKFPNLSFGMFAIFFYVGAEVSIGSNFVSFLKLPEIAGLKEGDASNYLAYYWGGAMIGRFLGAISLSKIEKGKKYVLMFLLAAATFVLIYFITFYMKGLKFEQVWYYLIFIALNYLVFVLGKSIPSRTLALFSIAALVLLITAIFTQGKVSMWCMLSIGLFNSIMWSNIFTLAIDGLGKFTSQGSSLLVMMILGGALLPPLQGLLADKFGVQISFFVPVVSYLYLIFYGWKGYKHKVRLEI